MTDSLDLNTALRLQRYIERVESLEEEKKALAEDIKDIYNEARATGFDAKIMRNIVRLRAMDPQERSLQESLIETYMHAMGVKDENSA
jgi:uncharacterized protein (UPF0335 family)